MSISDWNIDKSWTLFLDRDGVINKRIWGGYVTKIDEFEFNEGAKESIAELREYFNLIIVVTNQQGIAKGIMDERNLLEIHNYMCDQIYRAGGKIDKCYFAPNLKGASEDMRKPGPQMALLAKEEFPQIDFSHSVMVGDTDSDILFGRNLGMKTVRIITDEEVNVEADLSVNSLKEFLKELKK